MRGFLRKAVLGFCSVALGICTAIAATGCASCNGSHDEHVWDDGVEQTAATCTTDGVKLFTCECGETKTEVIPAKGHNLQVSSEVAATCTEDGEKKGVCTACGLEDVVVLHATGHEYESTTTQPTCDVDGYVVYTCKNCDDEYRETGVRATGHITTGCTWVEDPDYIEVKDENTCTYTKRKTTTCTACEETVEQYYDVVKHNYSVEITTQPTCMSAGVKTFTCDDCGNSYTESYAIVATAHTWETEPTTTQTVGDKVIKTFACTHNSAHTKKEVEFTSNTATVPQTIATQDVEIKMETATMKMDDKLREQIGGDVELTAETLDDTTSATANMSQADKERLEGSTIFNFNMTSGGNPVNFNGGKMTVSVPYSLGVGEDPENISIWYIADDGTVKSYEATYANGFATFEAEHFSYYTVVRMTPAERCAKYGHKWETKTVEATCTEEGFTLKYCEKCDTSEYSNVVAPLTHNYTTQVTAPTCTEKGFTTYTCEKCNDKYISNYVNATSHTYVDTVVAPTCTAKGYTVHTCSVCKKGYTDTFVKENGHTYASGACSVCGAKDPTGVTNVNNFYFTLAESVVNAKSFLVDLGDVDVRITVEQTMEGETVTQGMFVTIDVMEAFVAIGEDDAISAQGEMEVHLKQVVYDENGDEIQSETEEESVISKFVLQDGKLYAYAENGEMKSYAYQVLNVDEEISAAIEAALETEAFKKAQAILESVKNVEDSPLNKAFADMVNYFYVKTETADTYTFTFNYDKLPELYTIVTTETLDKVYERLNGEGSYAKLEADLIALLDKTVSAALSEIYAEAAKWGLDYNAVFDLINTILNMNKEEGAEDFDVRTVIAQMNELKVSELLDMAMGAETSQKEAYVRMIQQYLAQGKEMTFVSLAEMFMGMAQGGNGGNGGAVQPMNATEEPTDPLLAYINDFVAALKASPMSFTTDKFGALLSVDGALNVEDYTINVAQFGVNVTANAEGTMRFVVNGTSTSDYSNIIAELEKGKAALAFKDGDKLPKKYAEYSYDIKVVDGVTYAIPEFDKNRMNFSSMGEPVEATYNGQACMKLSVSTWDETLIFQGDISFTIENSCQGWKEYYLSSTACTEDSYYFVYMSESGEFLGVEVDLEATLENIEEDYNYGCSFYYHASDKKYQAEEPHNWKLVETKEPTGCEKHGYKLYVCTVCGAHEKETLYQWHKEEASYALKAGSTSCEDGVIETWTCTLCNEVTQTEEITWHAENRFKVELTGAKCQNMAIRYSMCPCGDAYELGGYEYTEHGGQHYEFIDGDCMFDTVDSECVYGDNNQEGRYNYWKYVYRCAVTNCGYTYVQETWEEDAGQCLRKRIEKFTVGVKADGSNEKVFTFESTNEYHADQERTEYEDAQKDVTVTKWICKDCGATISEYGYKHDEYGRIVRHWDYLEDRGFIREYVGCTYAEYEMNADGTKGGMHYTSTEHRGEWHYLQVSCTQYEVGYNQCNICGEVWGYDEYVPARGHNYEYDEAKGTYVCTVCDMENATGVDGSFYLEVLNNSDVVTIGFFNRGNVLDFEGFTVQVNNGVRILDIDTELTYYKNGPFSTSTRCGRISFSKEALSEALEALADEGVTVESVSVVFTYADPNSGNYDPETGRYEGSYLEEAVTFTLSELFA